MRPTSRIALAFSALSTMSLLVSAAAFAASESAPLTSDDTSPSVARPNPGLDLLDFRVSQFSVFQSSGGNSFSGWASWNPLYIANGIWGLRGALGAGLAKGADTSANSIIFIGEASVLATYQLNGNLALEAGPGLQRWFSSNATPFVISLGAVYNLDHRPLGIIQGVAFDYSPVFLSNNLTHELRIGVVF